ncbi:preprotein translocase subunit YajC [Pullulanibacillus sp. KACC 23026]|uniref:preprotein translocase subunit YajC n=1 Tax=Pullulanibacillus sp. KACC 23026 TaxID=3028315 RepID=UPI0023AEAEA9|nr:preprotein translocase subunit YajC [Pullulanibacillus sp. KACC 23026]WEG14072.1 preprotein translocase subunit YajC [Pullulanibacillus sp. KACC 23026]
MGALQTIGPLIIFFAIFYFLLIRPQQNKQKKTKQMQSSLGKGDKIITIGGLHGVVDTIDDSTVTIKCNGNSRLTFDRQAIRDIVEKRTNPHEKKSEKSLEAKVGEAKDED